MLNLSSTSAALPSLSEFLTLVLLVGIFWSVRRLSDTQRVRLWLAAWTILLAGTFAQISADVLRVPALGRLSLFATHAAVVLFVISVANIVEDPIRRRRLYYVLGVPLALYGIVILTDSKSRWPYMICVALCFLGGAAFFYYLHRRFNAYVIAVGGGILVAGTVAAAYILRGAVDDARTAILAFGLSFPGVLFLRNFWTPSPSAVAVAVGFILWGLGTALQPLAPAQFGPELWNAPKYFLAFGMILTVLEEKASGLSRSMRRQQALKGQLERFASITSTMLSGTDVKALCKDITYAITETSTFRRAAVLLEREDGTLAVAGCSGFSRDEEKEMEAKAPGWNTQLIERVAQAGKPLGAGSYFLKSDDIRQYSPVSSTRRYSAGTSWGTGDVIVVPLLSHAGRCVGCLSLDDPEIPELVSREELANIETLASDVAISVEVSALQRHILRTEKLASLGQLTAGVAHELNNPLTAIFGYADLLEDELTQAPQRHKTQQIRRAADRMRKIIDSLLRFAHKRSDELDDVSLPTVVEEVIAMFEYQARSRGIEIHNTMPADLPRVVGNERQLGQILANLIKNAFDAVENQPTRMIYITASLQRGHVVLRVEDTGPGFANLERALDPFYTTKPVGKGTGLGLSISYGLVKAHGGDMTISNVASGGASVSVQFLPATRESVSANAATAGGAQA